MGKCGFVEKMMHSFGAGGEPMMGQPILEVIGDCRVLIENHHSICEYGQERIAVRTKIGLIYIYGQHLILRFISKERLVITGNIDTIQLQRG